jgi:hypothetical protein
MFRMVVALLSKPTRSQQCHRQIGQAQRHDQRARVLGVSPQKASVDEHHEVARMQTLPSQLLCGTAGEPGDASATVIQRHSDL